MTFSRRRVLSGLGVLAVGGVSATTVLGNREYSDQRKNIQVKEVNAEDEYVVFANTGDSDLDISKFVVEFDYSNPEYSQARSLPNNTIIRANGTLKVATGAKEVDDADVTFDYTGEVINNDEQDTVALLTTDPIEDEAIAVGSVNNSTTTTSEETTTTTEDETDSGAGSDDKSGKSSDKKTDDGDSDSSSDSGGDSDSGSEGSSDQESGTGDKEDC
ncbi:lamin tail domain-containing protein [Haladaptatus caseinilyticus]|uniref:lamin tail domain-containing protein n=1 Tax=Haladaptatus caseinilyticus TaxID=2993314 RepID=UPI00224AEC28|nr:lamin tail domain-containing protein [Haladaptatus caseinilyticus]